MKSFATIIAFSAALAGFAAAQPALESRTYGNNNNQCGDGKFWYGKFNSCLQYGGPKSRPTPPRSRDCPPSKWYWDNKQGCCSPEEPDVPEEPTCKKGYSWSKGSWCCEENTPPPSTTTRSSPSQTPVYGGGNNNGGGSYGGNHNGGGSYNNGHWKAKRSHTSRHAELCPSKLTACPIAGATSFNKSSDYECVDPLEDLRSCGGCPSLGKGQDCTSIPHSWNVGCVSGSCEVFTCAPGYETSFDGKTCIPL